VVRRDGAVEQLNRIIRPSADGNAFASEDVNGLALAWYLNA
jgi:hypothetical protein